MANPARTSALSKLQLRGHVLAENSDRGERKIAYLTQMDA